MSLPPSLNQRFRDHTCVAALVKINGSGKARGNSGSDQSTADGRATNVSACALTDILDAR